MPNEPADAYLAGRLIQWGLRVKERPALQSEYKELIDRLQDRSEFRTIVNQVAQGLGLRILDWGEHGLALAPEGDSPFALKGASFRSNRADADERLLDGLVQVAIAATLFPTPQELEEDAVVARPPVVVDEIDETLRRICESLAEHAKGNADPSAADVSAGVYEAWRVYQSRLSMQETRDERAAPRSTHRIIERNLVRLTELGCFVQQRNEVPTFQATWRYHVLVKELAATTLYARIQILLDQPATSSATAGPRVCPK
ncbi:hypothetical protein [Anatilimnocola floriformis]|uniref:hypothetical protein n=1 Tax=Anatilimnocola floriformis TaxID=2948575 RepID=UPI0020C48CE2|nr:hypothetical protein [Anatilimnocola floriformis]